MSDVAVGSLTRRLGGSCDAVAINMLRREEFHHTADDAACISTPSIVLNGRLESSEN